MRSAPEVTTPDPAAAPAERNTRITPLFSTVALIAGLVAAAVASLSATEALDLLGIPSAGPATTYGLPVVQGVGLVAGTITIGSLLLAAFLVPPQASGVLDVDGYRAVRTASVAAAVWAACSVVMVPLVLSDASGQPFTEAIAPANLWSNIELVELAGAWRWTALLAVAVAVAARLVLRWGWAPPLLGLSILTLMPLALTGHSAAGGNHDIATNSLIIHLVAAALWTGGLLALLAHARRRGAHADVAARRFSALALVCFGLVGASGVVNALVRMQPSDLLGTTYGQIVLAKVVALVVLGVFGYTQRRAAVRALTADPQARGPLARIAAIEVVVLAATYGLAVGLSRTPPPPPASVPTVSEVELGYNLAGPPTFARLLFDWRFDLIFGTAALVLAALYVVGVRRLRQRGDEWPVGRTVAWLSGCAVVLLATSSGVGKYAPADFAVHMGAHMALSMLAPVLLVLGGAMTLALRVLTPAGKSGVPGPREWILAAVHNPVSRVVTQPVIAAVIFVAGFYVLYLGGIFNSYVDSHAAHVLMNLHFLLSGYLFYWVVIGVDPSPHQVQPVAKLAVVFGSLPFHAFFGITLMNMQTVLGGWYYQGLDLPWQGDLLEVQRNGGGIAWSFGEMPLVIVMLALLVQWSRTDNRTARRYDRAAERDDSAQLAAHNAMFRELARREREGYYDPK